ncbi:hypothetical protein ACFLRF_05870 [Candidatus Altiarchaeota archaeon]
MVIVKWLSVFLVLALISQYASAIECPPGFEWQRMSGVGCVQPSKTCKAAGGGWSYTRDCICRDKKGCYEPVDYTSFDRKKCGNFCPGRLLIACVEPGQPCPNEKLADTPQDDEYVMPDIGLPEHAQDPVQGPEPPAKECKDYCAQLTPIALPVSGTGYPDCECHCGNGHTYEDLKCVSCKSICQGTGNRIAEGMDNTCSCFCESPLEVWDKKAKECKKGTYCNSNNKCELALGETCKCMDCSCTLKGKQYFLYNTHNTCDPQDPKADPLGCVFDPPSDQELLQKLKEEEGECTLAWVLLRGLGDVERSGDDLALPSGGPTVEFSTASPVGKWSKKSGCMADPGALDSFVSWRSDATVEPWVCIAEYCRVVISKPIKLIEERMRRGNDLAVVGPGIKYPITTDIRSSQSENDRHAQLVTGGSLQQFDSNTVYGDRSNYVATSNGLMSFHSEYLLEFKGDGSFDAYLFEGRATYHHLDVDDNKAVLKESTLKPGQKLKVDAGGGQEELSEFDSSSVDKWWVDQPYHLNCPRNSRLEGADCVCDNGYGPDLVAGTCVGGMDPVFSGLQDSYVPWLIGLFVGFGLLGFLALAVVSSVLLLILIFVVRMLKR